MNKTDGMNGQILDDRWTRRRRSPLAAKDSDGTASHDESPFIDSNGHRIESKVVVRRAVKPPARIYQPRLRPKVAPM